ncbi:MAG TPA: formylglycine-generating enzyme family protein, partial [Thermoanaerobaculia bacterium]|nr:formylglycine-generating enzyme family protein [Thermoanaerobaculia bacterium]
YAARAGRQTAWSFGDDEKLLGNYAWYEKNAGGTPHPVGMKEPNDWGLHDMHGNVWEWVADWYGMYPATAKIDPTGPLEGEYRVLRGASFAVKAQGLRSADRDGFGPQFRFRYVGFRCARALRHPSSRSPNH